LLLKENKLPQESVPSQFLQRYAVDSDIFLLSIVMGGESLFQCFDLETKRPSMGWQSTALPKTRPSPWRLYFGKLEDAYW
jgi:hypothetical protein